MGYVSSCTNLVVACSLWRSLLIAILHTSHPIVYLLLRSNDEDDNDDDEAPLSLICNLNYDDGSLKYYCRVHTVYTQNEKIYSFSNYTRSAGCYQ